MAEEKKGLTRREFAKKVGIGTVAASLAIPALSSKASADGQSKKLNEARPSAPVYPGGQKDFEFISVTPFPMMVAESNVIYGKKTSKVYKDDRSLKADIYIELNGMATVIVELCNGGPHFDEIVNIVAEIYNVDGSEVKGSVLSFIKFLFEEGYICFVSEKAIPPYKKQGGGITVPDDKEPKIKVLSQPGESNPISF